MFFTSYSARNNDLITMLRSKKDVDRHVRDLLNKVKGEDEVRQNTGSTLMVELDCFNLVLCVL